MDKNSDPHVSKQDSSEKDNHNPLHEENTLQNSQDELSNFTRSDERSNVYPLPKLQSTIPEDMDVSAYSVESNAAETASYIPRLSVAEQSPESTPLLEQRNNFNDLSKRHLGKRTYAKSTMHLPPEKQSTDVNKKHKTTVEAICNKNYFLSTEQVNNKLTQESQRSAADTRLLFPEEEKHRLLREDENHTNSVHASEKDLKSPCPSRFSENSKLHKFCQTDQKESTRQSALDSKTFSDGRCQTDDIKFLDSQTDAINALEHQSQVNFEKLSENNTCVTECSTIDSGTLKRSEGKPDTLESFLYTSDTSKHSEGASSTTEFSGCDSYSADISASQSDTEDSSESQRTSELSSDSHLVDSQTDSSELSDDTRQGVSALLSLQGEASHITRTLEIIDFLSNNPDPTMPTDN